MAWKKRKHEVDFNYQKYRNWAAGVKRRDKRCQFPGCSSKIKLQSHHILPWASYPHLRYELNNGICLCKVCHDKVNTNELLYASLFQTIVNGKKK